MVVVVMALGVLVVVVVVLVLVVVVLVLVLVVVLVLLFVVVVLYSTLCPALYREVRREHGGLAGGRPDERLQVGRFKSWICFIF